MYNKVERVWGFRGTGGEEGRFQRNQLVWNFSSVAYGAKAVM